MSFIFTALTFIFVLVVVVPLTCKLDNYIDRKLDEFIEERKSQKNK